MDHQTPYLDLSTLCHAPHEHHAVEQVLKRQSNVASLTTQDMMQRLVTGVQNYDEQNSTEFLELLIFVREVVENTMTRFAKKMVPLADVLQIATVVFRSVFQQFTHYVYDQSLKSDNNCPLIKSIRSNIVRLIKFLSASIFTNSKKVSYEQHVQSIKYGKIKFAKYATFVAVHNVRTFLIQLLNNTHVMDSSIFYMKLELQQDTKLVALSNYGQYWGNHNQLWEQNQTTFAATLLHMFIFEDEQIKEEWIARFKQPLKTRLDDGCAVCIDSFEDKEVAVLSGCSHLFCMKCHLRWTSFKQECSTCRAAWSQYLPLSAYSKLKKAHTRQ
jgi:hypothetical protein